MVSHWGVVGVSGVIHGSMVDRGVIGSRGVVDDRGVVRGGGMVDYGGVVGGGGVVDNRGDVGSGGVVDYGGMVGLGSVVGLGGVVHGLGMVGGTLVLDIGHKPVVVISVVVDVLGATVGQEDGVGSLHVAGTVGGLAGVEVGSRVIVMDSVFVGVGLRLLLVDWLGMVGGGMVGCRGVGGGMAVNGARRGSVCGGSQASKDYSGNLKQLIRSKSASK